MARTRVQFWGNDSIQTETVGGDVWGGVRGKVFSSEKVSDWETKILDGCSWGDLEVPQDDGMRWDGERVCESGAMSPVNEGEILRGQ